MCGVCRASFPMLSKTSGKPRRRFRIAAVLLAAMIVIVAVLVGGWWFAKQKVTRERSDWKITTLERLAERMTADAVIGRELEQLRAVPSPNIDFGWAHDNVLLMANGEYIIFAFWHSPYRGFVGDLFLGHTADGRWLYSSYHFCHRMAAVRGDAPPKSIADFEARYFVREFDGQSDDCLHETWLLGE